MPFDFKKFDAKCATMGQEELQREWEHYTRLISGAATSTAVSGMAIPFTLGVSVIGVGLAAPAIHNARKKREIIEKHLQRHGTTHKTRKRDVLGSMAVSGTVGVVTLGVGSMGADAVVNAGAEHGVSAVVENELAVKAGTHLAFDVAAMKVEQIHTTSKKESEAFKAHQQALAQNEKASGMNTIASINPIPNAQYNHQLSSQYNQQYNPQLNPAYNQQYNPQPSLQYNPPQNLQPNLQYNTQYNPPHNPEYDQSQNPHLNQPLNPQYNPQPNPPYNPPQHQERIENYHLAPSNYPPVSTPQVYSACPSHDSASLNVGEKWTGYSPQIQTPSPSATPVPQSAPPRYSSPAIPQSSNGHVADPYFPPPPLHIQSQTQSTFQPGPVKTQPELYFPPPPKNQPELYFPPPPKTQPGLYFPPPPPPSGAKFSGIVSTPVGNPEPMYFPPPPRPSNWPGASTPAPSYSATPTYSRNPSYSPAPTYSPAPAYTPAPAYIPDTKVAPSSEGATSYPFPSLTMPPA